jgi:putative hemolysin
VAHPVVRLLDASTRLIFRLLRIANEPESAVTEEEVRSIVAEAEAAGAIETEERDMISGVMRLADKSVRGLMTPRPEVEWIDLDLGEEGIRTILLATRHSRLPVGRGGPDAMIGVLQVRELMAPLLSGHKLDIGPLVRQAPIIPDTLDSVEALARLRSAEVPMALVHDEYGHFEGLVTPADVLDAIAGAFRSDEEEGEDEAVRREDGSWLIAGWMPADEMADLVGLRLPANRDYETVAGLVIAALKRLPKAGECVEAFGWRFEVVDLDGRRIDKVIATKLG